MISNDKICSYLENQKKSLHKSKEELKRSLVRRGKVKLPIKVYAQKSYDRIAMLEISL